MSFATVIISKIEKRIAQIKAFESMPQMQAGIEDYVNRECIHELEATIKMIRKEYNEYVD